MVLLFLFSFLKAWGQTPTGSISGVISDPSGASVPGAKVTIRDPSTNISRSVPSDSDGRYIFTFVQPGTYTVSTEASAFRSASQTGVHVSVSETSTADFRLAIGPASESVEVSSNTERLDTETSNLATTISSRAILDLPDNGRNPFDFALLAPTVSNVGGASTPHIGGSRNGNNEQLIDGMTNILPENNVGNNSSAYTPIIDSVQEVNVQTSVLEAEYGRFSGGIISLVTKGGSNQFHGSVFEFAEPSALGAKPFGSGSSPNPEGHRYQSGGTIGGFLRRDKTFFFLDFEDQRQAVAGQVTSSIPPAAWLTGNFSSYGSQIYNPYSVHPVTTTNANGTTSTTYQRDPFPGNIIPTNYLNTPASLVAQKVLSYYPKPTNGNFQQNFVETGNSTNNFYHFDTRVDQQFGSKWHSFIRFSHFAGNTSPISDYGNVASPAGYNGPDDATAYSLSFNNVVTFTPTLVGEFRYGFSKSTSVRTAFSQGFDPTTLGLPSSYKDEASKDVLLFPHFDFSQGWSDVGTLGYVPLQENPLAHDVNASLSKVLGGHTVKVGGEWRLLNLDFYQYGYPSGDFDANQSWTQKDPDNADGSGNSIASFLLGLPSSGYITNDPHTNQTSYYIAAYVQDDWKVTHSLTLNYGLRWDVELPRTESKNQLTYWDPTLPSPVGSVSPATGVSCPACGALKGQIVQVGTAASKYGGHQAPTQWKDFAPRFGFAFSPNQKLAIRGGYGLVFQPSALQAAGTSGAAGVEGFAAQTNFSPSFNNQHSAPVADLSNPYPSGFQNAQLTDPTCVANPTCVASVDLGNGIQQSYFNNVRTPYTQQWNLSVQYQLPARFVGEVAYLGNKGSFLIDGDPGRPLDQLPTSYLSQGESLLDQVPNPFYGKITTPGSSLAQPTIARNQLLRQYPQYNGVGTYRKPGASSIYHAFTVRVDRQLANGLSYTFAFTGSKAEDDSAAVVTYLGPTSGTFGDQYSPYKEFGLSAFDVSRILTSSAVYELPFGRGKQFGSSIPKGLDLIAGGWQLNGIVTYTTGTPVIIGGYNNGSTQSALFTGNQRPNATGLDYKGQGTKGNYFNVNALQRTPAFTIGTAPRVMPDVRNPSYNNLDASLIKNTRFGSSDRFNFQFRFEMFNTLNHQILGNPDANITDSNFGSIPGGSYANSARQVQIAGKFMF